jgi:hypothetical protein
VALAVEIPDAIRILSLEIAKLPGQWDASSPLDTTKDIGINWARDYDPRLWRRT